MNLTELGECTDCEYDKEHICSKNEMPKHDRLLHCVLSHEQRVDSWQMHNIHYASKEEVEMGEAAHVDEITYHSMLGVNYCPFCGVDLYGISPKDGLNESDLIAVVAAQDDDDAVPSVMTQSPS